MQKKRAVAVCATALPNSIFGCSKSETNYLTGGLIVSNGLVASSFFAFFNGFLAICFLRYQNAPSGACAVICKHIAIVHWSL
jgi:hypothetical protein